MNAVMNMEMQTPIRGLFETHLTVRDLDRSITFYRDVVGLELALRLPARNVAFFWIGGRGRAMLGVWGVGSAPMHMQLHFAFDVALADVLASPAKLKALGVEPLGFNGEPIDEPVVIGWMPAASVYFKDPDGHSLEFISMLPEAAQPELGVVPYQQWLEAISRATQANG